MKKALIIFAVLILMAAAFFATAFFLVRWELKKSLPEISGTITLKGLSESVDVYRDEFGIPHIYAENRDDLMFAVGYVSAQDRLWQMDLTRRAATGKLAEIFGEPVIAADLVARTIGFGHIAIRQFENLSPDSQAILEAFSGGVNAYIERAETLPPEFRLLKFEPEPWRPSDSLATLKLIGWQLSKNYKSELALMRVAARLDDRRAADLRPSYPATGPLIISLEFKYEPVLLPYFDKGTQLLDEIAGISGGSNSWVIGPSLTKSGAPLLANDPHLSGTRIPSIWYFVHMVGAGYDTMGAVAPGSPLPLIGHNRRIGWGITNMNADIQDLYIEKINPANGDQYEYDGKWVDMQSRTERIGFRTADGSLSFLEKQIRSTIHGPLINDIAPGAVKAVSLRWTGLEPTPDFEALTRLNLAGNWEDFLGAMEKFSVAPQNFIYADVDGNIGYCGAGKIPIRKRGDGSMPQEGWTSENGWEGFIPFEEMPRVLNPSAGYIVTANNKVVSDAYKHLLSAQWAPSYRAKRIVELIETRAPHDAAGTARMHLDSKSLLAEFIVPKLTPALEGLEDRTLRKAANYLKEWNYENTTDSVAATIYHELLLKLAENTFADDMGREAASNYLEDYYLWLERFVELLEEDSHWFDDDLTKEIEKRDELIARSFREAVASLKGRLGGNMSKWQWGRVHQIEFRHPLDKISLIKRIFNLGPFPFPGDGETVNRGTFSFNKPYGVTMAASIRHIMDFSDLSETLGIHTTGQSGNPASSHYDDFAQPWLRGEYVKMRMNREYYIGEIEAHMTLAPAAPARAALN